MPVTPHQIGPALAVTPFEVGGLTEEEARSQFKLYRWADNEGRPTCPKCGCDAVNTYRVRRLYKCKACYKQFTDTSGTPWAYRKLKYRQIMYLVASIAHNVQAKTVRDICTDMGVQYKTAFLWVHKLRNAIALKADEGMLSGEVEIDGAYFGGYVRPKNLKKTRSDLRKIPYRHNDRALSVTAARQRGGGIKIWVCKQETDARSFISASIAAGSVLFTDKASGWSPLRGRFELFQIDHSKAYYTPEACTNAVESLWALMRVFTRTHRHICQNYLDLYAAHAAWNLTKGSKPKGDALSELMRWMSTKGKSPLVGYFQGRKRPLLLHRADGTREAWMPRVRSETGAFIDAHNRSIPHTPRRKRDATAREGFTFISINDFLDDPKQVPDGPGVYALFMTRPQELLPQAFLGASASQTWQVEHYTHMYTGESYGLRSRILQHVGGTIQDSNLRETLLALLYANGSLTLDMEPAQQQQQAEQELNAMLKEQCLLGFKSCGYCRDVERNILNAVDSPLNVARSNPSMTTQMLKAVRAQFRSEVSGAWASQSRDFIKYRR